MLFKEGKSILQLESLMKFYGVTPYNMILLSYLGGSDFKIQIFDCYGLEIGYLESCTDCRNDSIAIDVLASTNKFSVLENFTCHHKLVITTAPRMDDSWSEVSFLRNT